MGNKIERPTTTQSVTCEVETACNKLHVILGSVEGEPIEVFIISGKGGECQKAFCEALGRMISLAMQHGAPLSEVIKQLKAIQCPKPITFPKVKRVLSCPDATAKALTDLVAVERGRKDVGVKECLPEEPDRDGQRCNAPDE